MKAPILVLTLLTACACSTPATPTTSPRQAHITWQDFHGVRLPLSDIDGPRVLDHDRAQGFSHTQQGALLAALHIAVRANSQWGPAVFEPTITEQVTGPDADRLLEQARTTYEQNRQEAGLPPGSPLGKAYVDEEAYRWQSYTPDAATVDLVSAGPDPRGTTVRARTRVQVVWRDGDWRVVAPLDGDWGKMAAPLTSLDGYTLFEE
ncbi:hypothetical protein Pth03_44890 [Planotetraspora thailandica]|uniref:DUF8175 domain-containing protein n=1 Tax=Planotetraspora thailandica TaxID=487172 RepID=A0A8J3VDX3_9ACTN|nr:hypothetical protein [Planotetraspora thailandica]GII56100.1 hypothetical protein Pth03_44890 [Planotetraspora thailandica]